MNAGAPYTPSAAPEGGRVIVVGAGAAGLCAAVAAREAGAEVLLVSKAKPGLASCSAHAGGNFTAPLGGLTAAEHKALTRFVGRGLCEDRLVEAVSEGAEAALARLRSWGVRYSDRRGGISVRPYSRGQTLGGTGLTLPLVARAGEVGVETREGVVVSAILRADGGLGRVAGVELYDPQTGEVSREPAGAVVVATGGAGAAFRRTDNPVRTTGDGYRLLLAAGVELFDMEFVQWYPIGYAEPGFPVWFVSLATTDHAPVENSAGERFYDRLLREWGLSGGAQADLHARDRSAVAVALEYDAGREVFLRYDLAGEETIAQVDELAAACFARLGGPRPVRVEPLVHYFCGGAAASADGATAVPGLYACGEVAGGADGANRASGNALTLAVVLGQRAGERAAGYVGKIRPVGQAEVSAAAACGSVVDLAAVWAANVAGRVAAAPTAAAIRESARAAIGRGLGVVRWSERIAACLDELRVLGGMVSDLAPATARDRMVAVECLSVICTGALVGTAALARQESRGSHFRRDFPNEDPKWRRHVILGQRAAQGPAEAAPALSSRIAAVGEVAPP